MSVLVSTCRLPSISALGHRQVGYLAFGSRPVGSPANCRWGADRSAVWRSGADLSAPQHIGVGGPTGRFPRKLPLGARHVGSPDTADSRGEFYGFSKNNIFSTKQTVPNVHMMCMEGELFY